MRKEEWLWYLTLILQLFLTKRNQTQSKASQSGLTLWAGVWVWLRWRSFFFPLQPSQCFALVAGKEFWLLLSSADTALSSNIPPISRPKVGKMLGGGTTRLADPNWPEGYSTPYDVSTDIKAEKRRGWWSICYLQRLPSGANPLCAGALLPGKWMDIARK